ncbi:MAG TPA: phospholipid carrier-dependent glycosyltransferase [Thermoanaerobaculia bacterium]|nr:phospholipid carrier-dependent glycosyltransferase [Thermoanaerobaculia bacterium]
MTRLRALLQRVVSNKLLVFLLALLVYGASTAGRLEESPDASFYLEISDAIRDGRLEVFLTKKGAGWSVVGFPMFVALAQAVTPDHWRGIILTFNVVCAAITAVLLVMTVRLVTSSVLAAAAALLFYLTAYDVLVWVKFVLTDPLYGVWTLATFYLLLRGVMDEPPMKRRRLWLVLALVAGFITRPAGIVLPPLVILTEWLIVPRAGDAPAPKRAVVLLIFTAVVAGFVVRAALFQDIRRWPLERMRPILTEYAAREKTGEVVWDRRETFHRPPVTIGDHLLIQADRFVRFFQVTSSGFSRTHNLISLAYYTPLFLFGIVGALSGLRGRDSRRRAVVLAVLLWIFGTALMHAVTILDFDWRYRLPVVPQLILLAACGVGALGGGWSRARVPAVDDTDQPWPAR